MSEIGPDDEVAVEVTLRVPGPWATPEAFDAALPAGYRLGGDGERVWLNTPPDADGGEPGRVPIDVRPFEQQFVEVFAGGVGRLPSEEDRAGVEQHNALVCLTLPAGSLARANAALRHAAALIEAGGHGVFVDNSGIAHGSDDWRDLAGAADEEDNGGVFYAYVCVYGSPDRLWSIGMHVLGHRDAELLDRSGDDARDDFVLRNFLAYSYRSGATIHDGDRLQDVTGGESLVARLVGDDSGGETGVDHPMRNPFGRYRLERFLADDPAPTTARGPG